MHLSLSHAPSLTALKTLAVNNMARIWNVLINECSLSCLLQTTFDCDAPDKLQPDETIDGGIHLTTSEPKHVLCCWFRNQGTYCKSPFLSDGTSDCWGGKYHARATSNYHASKSCSLVEGMSKQT